MDDKFKMPQSSYEEVIKVIKAYGHLRDAVGLEDVSRLTSLHSTIISRNVGFLLAIGVVTPGAKKGITPVGKALANALEHNITDEIARCWRTIVSDTDFMSRLIAAVKIRNGMDQGTLESHIAYSAGQPKKPQFMTGARTIIEILLASGLLVDEGGKYLPSSSAYVSEQPRLGATPSGDLIEAVDVESRTVDSFPSLALSSHKTKGGTEVRININVTCTPDDLESLGAKLKKMLREMEAVEAENAAGQQIL